MLEHLSPEPQEEDLLFKLRSGKKCNDAPCRLFVVNTSSVCMIIIACTLRTYHCNVGFGWAPLLETALHPIARPRWKREHNEDFLSRRRNREEQQQLSGWTSTMHSISNALTPFLWYYVEHKVRIRLFIPMWSSLSTFSWRLCMRMQ